MVVKNEQGNDVHYYQYSNTTVNSISPITAAVVGVIVGAGKTYYDKKKTTK